MNKIVASLAHATSEVTFAAANLNLDFSIFKFEAPSSYKPFGDKLSLERRDKAEYGTPHITARKLGALFNGTLPKTPTLITAYGTRVSEILPLIDSSSENIAVTSLFGQQLGADGTTIWAAATSGDGAVPVHLLACLLARTWSGPQATSVWAQMIAERKKEIAKGFEKGTMKDYPTLAAFGQEITRQQLAEWDASARAWVRAADEVKRKDLDSLRLIINDLNLPIDSESDLYKNVTNVWHSSMTTIENLLNGIPQTVYNGTTLLGISSWHILPDVVSFRPSLKEIKHNDKLVRPGGVLTVGLQYVPRDTDHDDNNSNINEAQGPLGVFWSLSLSHLKFYGPPVQVSHSLGINATRVTFDQFMLLALGSLSARLKGSLVECSKLFIAIWTLFEETTVGGQSDDGALQGSESSPDKGKFINKQQASSQDKLEAFSFIRRQELNWVKLFHEASSTILESEGVDLEVACMLANCGRRRGKQFWSSLDPVNRLFGLCDLRIVIPLLKDATTQIGVLRAVAQRSKAARKNDSLLLIRYPAPRKWDFQTESCHWEACSAVPSTLPTSKRAHDGSVIHVSAYKRFIIIEGTIEGDSLRAGENRISGRTGHPGFCTCPGDCLEVPENPAINYTAANNACPCKYLKLQCTRACHFGSKRECLREPTDFDKLIDRRLQEISALGEYGFVSYQIRSRRDRYGPGMEEEDFYFTDSRSHGPHRFEFVAGCPQETCLYGRILQHVTGSGDSYLESRNMPGSYISRGANPLPHGVAPSFEPIELSYDDMISLFKTHKLSIIRLISYLDTGTTMYPRPRVSRNSVNHPGQLNESQKVPEVQEAIHRSLRALAHAADVYKLLPSVTVAMSTILFPDLYKAQWVPGWSPTPQKSSNIMPREHAFACLAMFETGTLDLSPASLGDVMAMASGDSLFISNTLLCDPSQIPKRHEITRVVGNIGKAGLAMLIAPPFPRSKEAALGDWNCISHAPFTGESFDGFKSTSTHLSFTGYTAPLLSTDSHGIQDIEAYLLETVLSVYNSGEWIGDLDVLKTLESKSEFVRVDQILDCGHDHGYKGTFRFVVCDSWEELLEGSEDTVVARAYQNWQARLALTCIAVQRGYNVFVLPDLVCWQCLYHGLQKVSRKRDETEGNLLIM
ncbi:hypothetical protein B0O99DRAFT_583731 [Bisporella sp. PMI_857]|nr:hypothetical protein B0O99DRAFT_583731 [Bisporella sp. PMI_857]